MDPRGIIRRDRDLRDAEKPLWILIDTASMNEELADGNDSASRVLQYAENREFRFVRTPETERDKLLEKIPPYAIEGEDNGWRSLKVDDEQGRLSQRFGYQEQDIRDITARVYSDNTEVYAVDVEDLTDQEVSAVRKVFVHAAFNNREEGHLFVTNREELLSHRRWFESHFPGGQLNIMCLQEAVEYLGLYLRYRDQFYAAPNFTVGKFGWYWHLFRSLIPFYHVEADADDDYMRGFSTRFQNLLIAIDEIGFQYFQKPDNRTQMNIQYHFDYAVSLITGVFDALALKTAERYDIDASRKEFISLTNNRDRGFLNEVRDANSDLRDHITEHMEFINLIYVLRPLVIHRGGYQDSQFEDRDEGWTGGVIPLDRFNDTDREDFERYYREIEDEPLPYDPITEWGVYQANLADMGFIEPYHFMKAAVRTLVRFINEYLQLLGYENFLGQRRDDEKKSSFVDTCDRIRQDGLTYLYQEFPEE